ncbi:hypothetical protein F2Q69_00061484 [Brassica cretica]|uniref:Uncharacterized protein n=1 Tax=Brassica cretica TaxID=69181 RepID=A0A8S9RFG9_BRACR|nr:hypothetical protein F2Q69_00061484 [Brassica cretica]
MSSLNPSSLSLPLALVRSELGRLSESSSRRYYYCSGLTGLCCFSENPPSFPHHILLLCGYHAFYEGVLARCLFSYLPGYFPPSPCLRSGNLCLHRDPASGNGNNVSPDFHIPGSKKALYHPSSTKHSGELFLPYRRGKTDPPTSRRGLNRGKWFFKKRFVNFSLFFCSSQSLFTSHTFRWVYNIGLREDESLESFLEGYLSLLREDVCSLHPVSTHLPSLCLSLWICLPVCPFQSLSESSSKRGFWQGAFSLIFLVNFFPLLACDRAVFVFIVIQHQAAATMFLHLFIDQVSCDFFSTR